MVLGMEPFLAYQISHGESFGCQSQTRKHTGKEKSEGKEVLHLGRQHREVATTLSALLPPQRHSIKPECKTLKNRREDWSKHDYAGFGADVIESSPQTQLFSSGSPRSGRRDGNKETTGTKGSTGTHYDGNRATATEDGNCKSPGMGKREG